MKSPIDENGVLLPDYWAPSDWIEHVPFLCWLVAANRPGSYVELGAGASMGYFAVCQTVERNALATHCCAVEDTDGTDAGDADPDSRAEVKDHNQRNFADFSRLLPMSPEAAAAVFAPGSVDVLNLGGADPQAAMADGLWSWADRLSRSGVLILPGLSEAGPESPRRRLWEELAPGRPAFDFPHQGGLGIAALGPDIPPALAAFLAAVADPVEAELVRRVFARLGRSLTEQTELRVLRQDIAAVKRHAEVRIAEQSAAKEAAEAALMDFRVDLARARSRPISTLWDYLRYRLLASLAGFSPPLPAGTAARIGRSAEKRNPKRSLPEVESFQAGAAQIDAAIAGQPPRHAPEAFAARSTDPARPTVLVVSDGASQSDAALLAWNLATALAEACDVVTLTLEDGNLRAHFRDAGVVHYECERRTLSPQALSGLVREICTRHPFAHALVSGVMSRGVLPGLRASGVPVVALLSEFAADAQPSSALKEVFRNADQIVFSSRLALESALATARLSRSAAAHILPPGLCRVPGGDAGRAEAERRWLDDVLRPGAAADREFVVIGAGPVDARKAVDLFIECATRVSATSGGARFRFVWFGGPDVAGAEATEATLLADQVSRAGLQAQMRIVRATSDIDHACRRADLLLFSARADPLPNAALAALTAGTPVICFDRATGIADFLVRNGLGDACVAPYLDTAAMAGKILDLAADDAARAEVAQRGQAAALRDFDFSRYVARLRAIAEQVVPLERRIAEDAAFLRGQEAFRPDFFLRRGGESAARSKGIEAYTRASWTGIGLRKPMPGFHPAIFAERYRAAGGEEAVAEPFARFLQDGRPAGPWSLPVISAESPVALFANAAPRVALHIHAYFLEQTEEILARLDRNETRPDLFVSAPADRLGEAEALLARYPGRVAALQAVPNRGRDIGPFLTEFGPRLAAEYEIIGHVHTKKSADLDNPRTVSAWKTFLLENLLGGPRGGAMLDRIVTAMTAEPAIAIVYPDDPNVMGWTANRGAAETLARRLRLGILPDQFNFPIGTMFWMRAGLLERFTTLGLGWNDYPAEPLPYDGTVLHALERLFGVLPDLVGMTTAVTNVAGVTR